MPGRLLATALFGRGLLSRSLLLSANKSGINSFKLGCHVSKVQTVNMSSSFGAMKQPVFSDNFLFRQLFDRTSCTYTYLLADTETLEAVLIDPVIELAERDRDLINQLGLKLKYCINTHMHADHITGTGLLKKLVPGAQSGISSSSGAKADFLFEDRQKIKFGNHEIEVRFTPGHTSGCSTFVVHSQSIAFTGDTLLIRGCGRTDFQGGSSETLFESVWNNVLSLPDEFSLYPAHDYKGQTKTSVAEEKQFNPRLTKSKAEFVDIMANLNLAYPKMIDAALPANKVCGLYDLPDNLKGLMA